MKILSRSLGSLLLLSTLIYPLLNAYAQGTAFTYQGRLNDNTNIANGSYDLRFALYDAASAGGQQGGLITNSATAVTNGLFTVTLDFGGQFPGADRWLELAVRTNGGGAFNPLTPRQRIAATPYAVTAGNLTGALPAGQLSGTYSSPVTLNNVGNNFSGSGTGLTALNAGNLASGTVSDARLSGNVALRNATQTFTGANTMNNPANSFSGTFNGNFSGSGAALTNVSMMNVINGSTVTLTTNVSAAGFGFTVISAPVSGLQPISVTTADVNNDGKIDLLSANSGDSTFTVLTNAGNGAFLASCVLSGTFYSGYQYAIATADVNGDGKIDFIAVNSSSNCVSIFTNGGSGLFAVASSPTVGLFPRGVATADVNHDGKIDIISVSDAGNLFDVLTNNGSGGFAAVPQNPTIPTYATTLTVADFNGDSIPDFACTSSTNLPVFLGLGNGKFIMTTMNSGLGGYTVAAADVNADGKMDLITTISPTSLLILTNNGAASFGSNSVVNVGVFSFAIAAADFNGDTKVDLFCGGNGMLAVATNNGSGLFGLASTLPMSGKIFSGVAAADFNNDGTTDLVGADYSGVTLPVLANNFLSLTTNTSATFQGNFSGSTLTVAGTVTAGSFTGNGAGLTNLNVNSFSGSLAGDVTGTQAATVVSAVGGQSASSVASGTSAANAGTSANTASTLVKRDASGNFSAGIITANLVGNATSANTATSATTATSAATATTATTAISFSGSLAGDVTGTQGATTVSAVGGQSSANVASGVTSANAATSSNTGNTIVKRDASGSFSAGGITATNFNGNGVGLTNINASNLASGTVPDARLSANVALKNGSETFAGNLTINGFPIIARNILAPTNTATISPTSGYVKFLTTTTAVSLNATAAIANGPAIGAVLILEGGSDIGTVTVPDGANTRLGSNLDRVLGNGDTLTLLWDGTDWVETSFVNN